MKFYTLIIQRINLDTEIGDTDASTDLLIVQLGWYTIWCAMNTKCDTARTFSQTRKTVIVPYAYQVKQALAIHFQIDVEVQSLEVHESKSPLRFSNNPGSPSKHHPLYPQPRINKTFEYPKHMRTLVPPPVSISYIPSTEKKPHTQYPSPKPTEQQRKRKK